MRLPGAINSFQLLIFSTKLNDSMHSLKLLILCSRMFQLPPLILDVEHRSLKDSERKFMFRLLFCLCQFMSDCYSVHGYCGDASPLPFEPAPAWGVVVRAGRSCASIAPTLMVGVAEVGCIDIVGPKVCCERHLRWFDM